MSRDLQFSIVGVLYSVILVFSLDHSFKGPENTTPIVMQQLSDLFDRWDM
jgi:hypothetical protein